MDRFIAAGGAASAGGTAGAGVPFFLVSDHVEYGVAQRAEHGGGYQDGAHYISPFRDKSSVVAGREGGAVGFWLSGPQNQPEDPSYQEDGGSLP